MILPAVTVGATPGRPSPRTAPACPLPAARAAERPVATGTPCCADELAFLFGPVPPGPGEDPSVVDRAFLSERQPGGWTCASAAGTGPWRSDAQRHRVVDRYLSPDEHRDHDRLGARARDPWLLGRIAAKDAVRWWLADRGLTVEPDEVVIANGAAGRPHLAARGSSSAPWLARLDLRLSIAHLVGTGVAIVARAADVGIDVEEIVPRAPSFARVAFSAHERRVRAESAMAGPIAEAGCALGAPSPPIRTDDATWMAGAWCAKEAVGKARGTGLQGRPSRFVTHPLAHDLYAVSPSDRGTETLVRWTMLDPVRFCSQDGHPLVVGWTLVGHDVDLTAEESVSRESS
jgi:phosphopantetheinyl transferase